MGAQFILASEVPFEQLEWGQQAWFSLPAKTGAHELALVKVEMNPGAGHAFHKHPAQEEIVYVLEGEVEQWLETEKKVLKPGDAVFIEKGVVHASYNITESPAKVLAIIGPCVGEKGYEVVELNDQEPWNQLR